MIPNMLLGEYVIKIQVKNTSQNPVQVRPGQNHYNNVSGLCFVSENMNTSSLQFDTQVESIYTLHFSLTLNHYMFVSATNVLARKDYVSPLPPNKTKQRNYNTKNMPAQHHYPPNA
jgi:hypothetical protein